MPSLVATCGASEKDRTTMRAISLVICPSGTHFGDGFQNLGFVGPFQNVATGAGFEGLKDHFDVLVNGEHDDL